MEILYNFICFGIILRMSSGWLLPVGTEQQGNSRPTPRPLSMVRKVEGECGTIRQCLQRIKSLPENRERAAFTLLGQGISQLIVSSKLQNTLVEESDNFYPYTSHLIELYSATDGIHYEDGKHNLQDLWMFPNYFLLSLEEAIEIYRDFPRDALQNRNLYPSTEEYASIPLDEFPFSNFPIMASGTGDYIFIDLNDGKVFEYMPSSGHPEGTDFERDEDRPQRFSNTLELFKDILNNFKNGKYYTVEGVVVERGSNVDEIELEVSDLESQNEVLADDYDAAEDSPRFQKNTHRLFNRHGMPLLNLNCRGIGMICNFIEHSINDHGFQRTLCKTKKMANIKAHSRMVCGPVKRMRGSDCNQYPFEATSHSSSRAPRRKASLVTTVESNVLGAQIRAFYRATEKSYRRRKRCFKVVSP